MSLRHVRPVLAAASLAGGALVGEAAELAAYRREKRPLVVFAPSPQDPALAAQPATLRTAEAGLRERDMVVLAVTAPEAEGALRRAVGAQGFVVVLVGMDGGVKLRRDAPVSADALFAVVDAMPMRRREMGR